MRVRLAAVTAVAAVALAGCSVTISTRDDEPAADPPPSPSPTLGGTVDAVDDADGQDAAPSQQLADACRLMFDPGSDSVYALVERIKAIDVTSPREAWEQAKQLSAQVSADLEAANEQFPPEVQPYVGVLQGLFDLERDAAESFLPWLGDLVAGAGSGAMQKISDHCASRGLHSL